MLIRCNEFSICCKRSQTVTDQHRLEPDQKTVVANQIAYYYLYVASSKLINPTAE